MAHVSAASSDDGRVEHFIRRRALRPARAAARTAVFLLKVLPNLPSRPVDRVTAAPVRERVCYPTTRGMVEGELTRPGSAGPHPGVVLCLGVVPFDVDHPQVPRLQEALARAGFASLLDWSPAMRDFRLDPADVENLAMAYEWFIGQDSVDPERSGMIGTCVGGAFVLMAASQERIRDRVGFVGAFAPYASMHTFAEEIATATRPIERIAGAVDGRSAHTQGLRPLADGPSGAIGSGLAAGSNGGADWPS